MRKTGKLLSLLLCLALALALLPSVPAQAAGDVAINATNFPDANFRAYVSENFDADGNGKLSETEIAKIKIVGVYNKNISSVKGIEFFTSMTYLSCGSNQLTALDVSKNTALTDLSCGSNQLKTLDVSKNTALKTLYCNDNQLKTLDVSKNTALTDLSCSSNLLTALNVSKNTALANLNCNDNQLKSLDLSFNTALKTLYCSGNLLTSLNLSKCAALNRLYCDNNQLTSLTVGNSTALITLSCDKNLLKTLNVSKNTGLISIYCSNNQLTALDVSNNVKLASLSCVNNQLSSLDVSKNTALEVLHCSSNQIKTLNVTKNTKLTTLGVSGNLLKTLDLSKNTLLDQLSCASNQLTALDVSKCPALKYLYCYDNAIGTIYAHKDAPLTSVVKDDSTQLVRGTPTKPAITTEPKSVSVKVGETATFKVAASGANLKYQWYYQMPGTTSWTKVANNGTSATYKLTTAARHNGYLYTCKVYNDAGQVWSGNAKLTVLAKPAITTEPKSVSVKVGETATFKVAASGANLKYQWYYQMPGTTSWTKVANNGTSATYKLTTAARHNGYLYTCKVYNDAGQVWSGNAKLTVASGKPAITTEPKNVSVKAGETATFKVAASGANLKYQWYYQAPGTTSWTKVANNGTSATYKLTTAARHNGYLYTCKVYNDAGQVWSGNAKLTVVAKPTITTEPKSVSVKAGETATFKVAASGANLKYQWYYQAPGTTSWTKVANNGTSATYKLTAAARHNGYLYTCKVYNDAGQVWSGNAKLTVK